MTKPDLQIRRGGDGGRSQKEFFSTLRASVWSKNKGGAVPPGSTPGSATGVYWALRTDNLS